MSTEDTQIILNRIRTPDGTILTSYFRHDFKTHVDKNGETYMTDGGQDYLKRSVNTIPYEDLSVNSDSPFEVIRLNLFWGTRGKDGKSSLKWISISEMENSHLEAFIDLRFGSEMYRNYMKQELEYRKLNNIQI